MIEAIRQARQIVCLGIRGLSKAPDNAELLAQNLRSIVKVELK